MITRCEITDAHVHLWRHNEPTPPPTVDRLAALVKAVDVDHIAITEHFYRFGQARDVLGKFWQPDPDEGLREITQRTVVAEETADLDAYVDGIRRAQPAGLPVALGLEVDYIPRTGNGTRSYLEGYGLDLVLGSVHWIGARLFDAYEEPRMRREWERRGIEKAWDDYASAGPVRTRRYFGVPRTPLTATLAFECSSYRTLDAERRSDLFGRIRRRIEARRPPQVCAAFLGLLAVASSVER